MCCGKDGSTVKSYNVKRELAEQVNVVLQPLEDTATRAPVTTTVHRRRFPELHSVVESCWSCRYGAVSQACVGFGANTRVVLSCRVYNGGDKWAEGGWGGG